jgi:hypothetical protein
MLDDDHSSQLPGPVPVTGTGYRYLPPVPVPVPTMTCLKQIAIFADNRDHTHQIHEGVG